MPKARTAVGASSRQRYTTPSLITHTATVRTAEPETEHSTDVSGETAHAAATAERQRQRWPKLPAARTTELPGTDKLWLRSTNSTTSSPPLTFPHHLFCLPPILPSGHRHHVCRPSGHPLRLWRCLAPGLLRNRIQCKSSKKLEASIKGQQFADMVIPTRP